MYMVFKGKGLMGSEKPTMNLLDVISNMNLFIFTNVLVCFPSHWQYSEEEEEELAGQSRPLYPAVDTIRLIEATYSAR